MMTRIEEVFLSLVRLGIGNSKIVFPLPKDVDWNALEELAARQGLSAVMVDGIEKLPEEMRPPKQVLLQWIGETLQGFEYRYELYRRTIAELAAFYNRHGFKMMIVKGFACNLDWPKPEHRPCGDIDIWQFGQYKEADEALAKERGIQIDRDHHHHTIFTWRDFFLVENHYDLLNVYQHHSNVELEKIVKKLAEDDTHFVEVYGEKVYLPSANLHALFLLRHAMTHFSATEITLRQLLDWAFFMKEHGKEVDWKWLLGILDQYGMTRLFNIFNAICVEDLGFEVSIFPQVQFEPFLKERVLNDILSPEFDEQEKGNIIKRYFLKYRRWQANKWKHELCFNDRRWSAFWTGVWGHLLKPKSI